MGVACRRTFSEGGVLRDQRLGHHTTCFSKTLLSGLPGTRGALPQSTTHVVPATHPEDISMLVGAGSAE